MAKLRIEVNGEVTQRHQLSSPAQGCKQLDRMEEEWTRTVGKPGLNHAVSVSRPFKGVLLIETTEGKHIRAEVV